MSSDTVNKQYGRYFDGSGAALRVVKGALEGARAVRIATAYFEPSGYQCLRGLPDGIRSYKKAPIKNPNLYILFFYRNRAYPVLFNQKDDIVLDNDRMDEIMNLIRSTADEETYRASMDPDEMDRWVARSRNTWAAVRKVMPDDIAILCWMALLPG
jgi:hypothetical protein